MSALLFVAYASSATHRLSDADVEAILDVSRANNGRDDITGLLLYRGGNFLQALEGPEPAVRAAMSRIVRDPRHRSIVPLLEQWRDDRLFGGWAMAFDAAHAIDAEQHPGISRYLSSGGEHATFREPRHEVVEFFESFRDYVR